MQACASKPRHWREPIGIRLHLQILRILALQILFLQTCALINSRTRIGCTSRVLDKFAAATRLFCYRYCASPRLHFRYRTVSISRDLKFSHAAYLTTSRPISRDCLCLFSFVSRRSDGASYATKFNRSLCAVHAVSPHHVRLPQTQSRNDPLPH